MKKQVLKNNKINKRACQQDGFTLVETLIAIFILLVSITGPMAIAQSGLRAAFISRDQTTAFYLAQDAMEYVKNKRDDNMIDNLHNGGGTDWLSGVRTDCATPDGCTIDTTLDSANTAQCGGANTSDGCDINSTLEYDPLTGEFGFSRQEKSPFARVIKISEFPSGMEAEVTVTVTWEPNPISGQREITVQENIFNWLNL
jgi:prepilin-type N-terminal cleavage/methylation domain-containing protein